VFFIQPLKHTEMLMVSKTEIIVTCWWHIQHSWTVVHSKNDIMWP